MATMSRVEVKVRPMTFQDLDTILLIDHRIRALGKAVTYANLTTEHIFTIDKNINSMAHPISYIDLIKGNVSQLFEWGLVAEVEGVVRGFVLGEIKPGTEKTAKTGEILILGVHPDYGRRNIATSLVMALCDRFRSEKVASLHISIDERDKDLLAFFGRLGFSVGHLLDYATAL